MGALPFANVPRRFLQIQQPCIPRALHAGCCIFWRFHGTDIPPRFGPRNSSNLPFPIAALNVATVSAFHPNAADQEDADDVNDLIYDDDDDIAKEKAAFRATEDEARCRKTVKVFFLFFSVIFVWSFLINSWFQFLTWFPVLCWVCKTNACQVLGEGLLGVGLRSVARHIYGVWLFCDNLAKECHRADDRGRHPRWVDPSTVAILPKCDRLAVGPPPLHHK